MNRFYAFVRKEFFHILRDWRTLIILIGMPIAQILLFGFAITNEINNANIAILDYAKDDHSGYITRKILASKYFNLKGMLDSEDEIHIAFRKNQVKQVIVFPEKFGISLEKDKNAMVQILSDASDPNTATMLLNYTQAIIADYQQSLNDAIHVPMQISVEQKMLYNPELKGVYLFVPGIISVILMLVSAMMTSISITKEKELGTMEILLVTPMAPIQIILAKVVPYILLAFVNAITVLLLGYFVFHVPNNGSLALLLVEMGIFIVTALSLGIFISSTTSSQLVALMASVMALMLPTILLSGFIFPIDNMPLPLRLISNIVPAKWFIIIIKSIMLKGSGFGMVWKETLILIGFALVLIIVSVRKFKIRLT